MGTSVTLQCTTDLAGTPAHISWVRNPDTLSAAVIVSSTCQLNAAQYSVISSSTGQCDLVINNASRALGATYRCYDTLGANADADLTVIGELCALTTIGLV